MSQTKTTRREQIAKLVAVAAANFPYLQERDLSTTAELWLRMLDDIPIEICEAAVLKVLTTVRYFPTIAEVLDAVRELTREPEITAFEAWGELQRVVQRYGYYRQQEALAALSPKTAAVVQQFGWETICMTPMDDIPTLRAQFTRAFQALAERQKQNELLPPAMRKSIASERLRLASEAENKAREAG